MMESMFRWFIGLLLVLALASGAVYVVAGRSAPPALTIAKPDRVVGQGGALEVVAEAPKARFTALTIALEQNGKSTLLYSLANPGAATVANVDPNRLRVTRGIGKKDVP